MSSSNVLPLATPLNRAINSQSTMPIASVFINDARIVDNGENWKKQLPRKWRNTFAIPLILCVVSFVPLLVLREDKKAKIALGSAIILAMASGVAEYYRRKQQQTNEAEQAVIEVGTTYQSI